MKKTDVLWVILGFIFLVTFNAVFFVAGGADHKVSVWISYGFIHFAYFMLLLISRLIRGGKSAVVYGFTLYSVTIIYILLELVAGVIFILISPDSYKTALLVQLCIVGLFGIALISNMIANEHSGDVEEKRVHQINYVKRASMELKSLLDSVGDKETKKNVEKVYDALCSSPVKSYPELAQTELQILMTINDLGIAISAGNKERIIAVADSLQIMVNERNQQLKILNHIV